MLEVSIPGFRTYRFRHLVLDYNGTLACDGRLLKGVDERLNRLSNQLKIHILTADTFGKATSQLNSIPGSFSILDPQDQALSKLNYVKGLGPESTVCIGNGRNDRLMLETAALGIVVIQEEGTALETLTVADVVAPDILSALDLLLHPLRLVATLRS